MAREITVIKFGGSLSLDAAAKARFLKDIKSIETGGGSAVLVHGGGREVTAWLQKLGIKNKFINGLRYTDEKTLEVVEMVLSGIVNRRLILELNNAGIKAVGISGKDAGMVICKRIKKLGFVGEPAGIDSTLINALINNGFVPVLSSICSGTDGRTLNVNADSMAMALAVKLKARRLVLLTDVRGVLDRQNKTIPRIRPVEVNGLISSGIITGGMIPKVKSCVKSVRSGVKEVWIADGRKGLRKLEGTVIIK